MTRTEQKIMKLFKDLNKEIEQDEKKLSDKLELYKLSHNRMKKALIAIEDYTNDGYILKMTKYGLGA